MTDIKLRDQRTVVIDGDFFRRQAIEAADVYAAPFFGVIRAVSRITAPVEVKAEVRGLDAGPSSPWSKEDRSDLSLVQRLGHILAIIVGSGLAFGAVLAGLHAVRDLIG